MNSRILSLAAAGLLLSAGTVQADEWTANFAASNNYIWRGLTQSINEAAISGGIDYAADSGFYLGTWASNVSYAQTMSTPTSTTCMAVSLVKPAVSATTSVTFTTTTTQKQSSTSAKFMARSVLAPFTLGLNVLANTEADEGPGQDFGLAEATYLYADYTTEVGDGSSWVFILASTKAISPRPLTAYRVTYIDYNISLSKNGFSFMITSTDLDDAGPDALDNDDIKFVVGYGMDFEL